MYVNDSTVTCNDDEKTDCNIPELEINTKRAVQSISLQTNETRGHAALVMTLFLKDYNNLFGNKLRIHISVD